MKIVPLLLVLGAAPLLAQTPAATPPASQKSPSTSQPAPVAARATPTPQSSIRVRVRRAVPIATPTPSPSPKPTATPRPKLAKVRKAVAATTPAPSPEASPKKTPQRTRVAKATPTPEIDEEADKEVASERGFFRRIFSVGGFHERQPAPETTPEAEAQPEAASPTPALAAPNRPARRSSTPHPTAQPEDPDLYAAGLPSIQTGTTGYQSGLPPFQAAASSAPVQAPAAPSTPLAPEPATAPPALSPEPVVADLPPLPQTVELDRERYLKVKKEAAAAPEIVALSEKFNATPPGDAQKALARDYTKALFKKMESIDNSQLEWFQRLEAATLRRIDAGKPFVTE